jgi:hypothetical protein
VLENKNSKSGIHSFTEQDCILVLIALKGGEFQLWNLYLSQKKLEKNKTMDFGESLISSIAYLQKSGRVFYGGEQGHVKELIFEDLNKSWLKKLFESETKKITSIDH